MRATLTGLCFWVVVAFVGSEGVSWAGPEPERADSALLRLAERVAPDVRVTHQILDVEERAFAFLVLSDEKDAVLGFVFRTGPLASGIEGFGGPLDLAVSVTKDGVVREVVLLESRETPSYAERISNWLPRLAGHRIFTLPDIDEVDALTGATYSAEAVLDSLYVAGQRFAAHVLDRALASAPRGRRGPLPAVLFVVAALAAAGLRLIRPSRRGRQFWLAGVLLGFGLAWNLQYSFGSVLRLVRLDWPTPSWTIPFLWAVGVPVGVAIFGNLYCGWLCPFGALQELVGEGRRNRRFLDPDRRTWGRIRRIKYGLLAAGLGGAGLGYGHRILDFDPLSFAFGPDRMAPMFFFAVWLTGAAMGFGRFWCRNLCPTGAALTLLGRLSPFRTRWPRIQPGCCDLGVAERRTWDCLLCDRCRPAGVRPVKPSLSPRTRTGLLYGAILLTFVVWIGVFFLRREGI